MFREQASIYLGKRLLWKILVCENVANLLRIFKTNRDIKTNIIRNWKNQKNIFVEALMVLLQKVSWSKLHCVCMIMIYEV